MNIRTHFKNYGLKTSFWKALSLPAKGLWIFTTKDIIKKRVFMHDQMSRTWCMKSHMLFTTESAQDCM